MSEVVSRFDYALLDPRIGALVAEAATKIRSHGRAAAQNVIEIGKELLSVREALTDERCFGNWLKAEFGWSKSTAYNYMNTARQYPTVGNELTNVDLRTLYLLAAPSTPDWVRQVAQKSEGLTYTQARALIEDEHAGEIATELGIEALSDWRPERSDDREAPAPERQKTEGEEAEPDRGTEGFFDPTLNVISIVAGSYGHTTRYKTKRSLAELAAQADPDELGDLSRKAAHLAKWFGWLADGLS